jgi:hypothetical protein
MSSVKVTKKAVSPRSTKVKKKKLVQNQFELIQFKKMIGKGLVLPYKGATSPPDSDLKNKILSKSVKTIAMTGFISSGIIYVFEGVDRLLAINAVSYAEIKKADLEIDIILNQYSNLSVSDLT